MSSSSSSSPTDRLQHKRPLKKRVGPQDMIFPENPSSDLKFRPSNSSPAGASTPAPMEEAKPTTQASKAEERYQRTTTSTTTSTSHNGSPSLSGASSSALPADAVASIGSRRTDTYSSASASVPSAHHKRPESTERMAAPPPRKKESSESFAIAQPAAIDSSISSSTKIPSPPPPASSSVTSQTHPANADPTPLTPTKRQPSNASESIETSPNPYHFLMKRKRKAVDFTTMDFVCHENLPSVMVFAETPQTYRPLLPSQVTNIAYTALHKAFPQNGAEYPEGKPGVLKRIHKRLQGLLPAPPPPPKKVPRVFEPDPPSVEKLMRQCKEIVRVKSMHQAIWPLVQDFPLCYDWSESLGLGRQTGSAAFNRLVVHSALRQIGDMERHDVLQDTIPQLTPEQYCLGMRQLLRTMAPQFTPPPLSMASSGVPQPSSETEGGNAAPFEERLQATVRKLLNPDGTKSLLNDVTLMNGDKIKARLASFENRAKQLDERWERVQAKIKASEYIRDHPAVVEEEESSSIPALSQESMPTPSQESTAQDSVSSVVNATQDSAMTNDTAESMQLEEQDGKQ